MDDIINDSFTVDMMGMGEKPRNIYTRKTRKKIPHLVALPSPRPLRKNHRSSRHRAFLRSRGLARIAFVQIDSRWFEIFQRYIWCLRQPYQCLATAVQTRPCMFWILRKFSFSVFQKGKILFIEPFHSTSASPGWTEISDLVWILR